MKKKFLIAIITGVLLIAVAIVLATCGFDAGRAKYTVTLLSEDPAVCTVYGDGQYRSGETVTISAKTIRGYQFLGWYDGDALVSDDADCAFVVDEQNVSYTAKCEIDPAMGNFTFTSTQDFCMITGIINTLATEIVIPDYVTSIGNKVFLNCIGLTSVTIGDNVTSIGDEAFYYCHSLTSITIPDSVTNIGESAFSSCSNLISISIGNSVTSIGDNAFYRCAGLTSIKVSPENPVYHSEGNCLIRTADKTLVLGCCNSVIPSDGSVTAIENRAFGGCSNLKSITIPDSVTSIGDSAFASSGLTSITVSPENPVYHSEGNCLIRTADKTLVSGCGNSVIPSDGSVTAIENGAFWGCSNLKSITIPDSVTNIGSEAFTGCSSLTSIMVSPGNPVYHSEGNCLIRTENETLILGCNNSVIPSDGSVTAIGDSAFYWCSNLTNITIPDSVTNIGNKAFYQCFNLTSVVIPDSVTNIGNEAFFNCYNLTSVKIGDSVTSIGDLAFYVCSNLTSVVIPDSVTRIGDSAFETCPNLTSVTIGSGVTSIGEKVFYDCSNLTSITVSPENPVYHSEGNCLIQTADKILILGCNNSVIPSDGSVTAIGSSAFYGYRNLSNITIPDSVTSIGDSAFYGCSGLTSITVSPDNPIYHSEGNCLIRTADKVLILGCNNSVIPSDGSVTAIGDSAFYQCSNLTSITIPDCVTRLGDSAFSGCSSLTSVLIGNGVTRIGNWVFAGCSSLTSITIPDSVTRIGNSAFLYCYDLTSVTIPDSVTSIRDYAFYRCYSLTSLVIPGSVTSIGDNTFYNCSPSLMRITVSPENPVYHSEGDCLIRTADKTLILGCNNSVIPSEGVTAIFDAAFYGCSGLTSVVIPDGVTSIGDLTFYQCSNLTSIVIPDSVTSIGDEAFFWCSNLTSVVIPDSVTSIGDEAFFWCSNLTSVTIGSSVTSIGYDAFYGCTGLTQINYNAVSVTSFPQSDVFYGAGKNTDGIAVVFGDSVKNFPATIFSVSDSNGIPALKPLVTSVTIGNNVTSIGDETFAGCSSMKSVTIGKNVASIGDSAFYGCSGLTSITVSPENPVYHSEGNCLIRTADKILILGCNNSVIPSDGSVTVIGDLAFAESNLTIIVIPSSVTVIGDSAFFGCSGLASIVIPDSVTSIGDKAFYNCYNLTSVTIGKRVTRIGSLAFSGCRRIENVYISDLDAWNAIHFADSYANPLTYGGKLYLNGEEVTDGLS